MHMYIVYIIIQKMTIFLIWMRVINLLQGVYHVDNSMFDLGFISRTPIDPGKLRVNLSVFDYPSAPSNRLKRILVCLAVEVTVTQSKTLGSIKARKSTRS